MNLRENGNNITRNSSCIYGGDRITFFISNQPKEEKEKNNLEFITGVNIELTPFIPKQILGKTRYFKKIQIEENFDDLMKSDSKGVKITIPVVPEYSYSITGSYTTRFGKLAPSSQFIIEGEFENMMKKVGCYIRDDFVFPSRGDAVDEVRNISSSIECAKECHHNSTCKNGWSYQIATKDCFLYKENQRFDIGKAHSNKILIFYFSAIHKPFSNHKLFSYSLFG